MKYLALILLTIVMVGCGQRVEVPPAHVGKISTKDGYQANLIPTSKIRLDPCVSYCDRLVLLDVSDNAFTENLDIFIPEDKLNLTVAVRTTLSVNPKKTEELFNLITPEPTEDQYLAKIDRKKIYLTYAQQVVQKETREYLSQFSIGEIASSLEAVNAKLSERLSKVLAERTPFSVRYVGITNIQYPTIITQAQENAAERREKIQQEEAELAISRVRLDREFEEARLTRKIENEKAQTEAEAQRIQATTIDPRVLELRKIENEKAWIDKWNGQLPVTTLGESVPMINIGK